MQTQDVRDVRMIHTSDCKCFSMKPIIAGALVAIGLSFLLNLFSVAIGLTAYTTSSSGVESLSLGGLLGTAIGMVAAMFASGWVAGYIGKRHCVLGHLGSLYGFLSWCVALIVTIFLFGFLERYIYFYSHFIAGVPYAMHAMPGAMNNPAMANAMATTGATTPETKLVLSTYIVFILFFLGAFASSLGGHCGMRHVCKDDIRDGIVK